MKKTIKSILEKDFIVDTRNGESYYRKGFSLIKMQPESNNLSYKDYNNDLIHELKKYDIMRIYETFRDWQNGSPIWVRNEDIEPSQQTFSFLKLVSDKFQWVARDKCDNIYFYRDKPSKGKNSWVGQGEAYPLELIGKDLFLFIRWEDEEPINIANFLKGEIDYE